MLIVWTEMSVEEFFLYELKIASINKTPNYALSHCINLELLCEFLKHQINN